jgi:hypothetical protein
MSLTDTIARKAAPSYEVQIFIGGDHAACKNLLAAEALRGACYSVEPTEFIYTGGRETGSVVRLINYPRFPKYTDDVQADALRLAEVLMLGLHQSSCTVQGPDTTLWLSRRSDA